MRNTNENGYGASTKSNPILTMPEPKLNGFGEVAAKTIPADLNAEMATLGSILIDPEAIRAVESTLKPADFYRERHGWVYEAMLQLHRSVQPLDSYLLASELESTGRLEGVGGMGYLVDLANSTPSSMYVEHYAKIVRDKAIMRRVIATGGKIAEIGFDGDDVQATLAQVSALAMEITQAQTGRGGLLASREIMISVIDQIDLMAKNGGRLVGVPTGFKMLDSMLGGLQKSDLIILGARPGMGKSGMALSIAENAAVKHGVRVALFSLEMSKEQMAQRLLSMRTGIDSHRLRLGQVSSDEEWNILMEAANELAEAPIYIDDTPSVNVHEVRSKATALMVDGGLDLLIIDYLQLMTGDGKKSDNREQEIGKISRSLKALAKELNIPILALSQLSRAVEARADHRPMLSDLRDSGSVEQDADVVLFIYREDYYVEDTDRQNIADILVAKHRHGSTGTVSLYFRKELTQFRDLEIERTDLGY